MTSRNDITNGVQLLNTDKSRCPYIPCNLTTDWLFGLNNVASADNLEIFAKHTQYILTHDPLCCMEKSPVTIGRK
jgi:hypothetical protein